MGSERRARLRFWKSTAIRSRAPADSWSGKRRITGWSIPRTARKSSGRTLLHPDLARRGPAELQRLAIHSQRQRFIVIASHYVHRHARTHAQPFQILEKLPVALEDADHTQLLLRL